MASAVPVALSFFVKQGWSPAQAAGIVANLWNESKLNPVGPPGDAGAARGIAQWHPDRQARLRQYAASTGGNPGDLLTQLGFVHWELNNTERAAGDRLRAATNPAQAAALVDQHYERSAGLSRGARMRDAVKFAGAETGWVPGPGGAPIHAPAWNNGPIGSPATTSPPSFWDRAKTALQSVLGDNTPVLGAPADQQQPVQPKPPIIVVPPPQQQNLLAYLAANGSGFKYKPTLREAV